VLSALWGWFVAFFFTQLFEMPIYWKATRSLRVGFFASAITHPVVWFVFPLLMEHGLDYVPMVVLAELFAVLVEAAWLRFNGMKAAPSLVWSLAANAFSATMGFVSRAMFGFP
jgi:hypothetical protein